MNQIRKIRVWNVAVTFVEELANAKAEYTVSQRVPAVDAETAIAAVSSEVGSRFVSPRIVAASADEVPAAPANSAGPREVGRETGEGEG